MQDESMKNADLTPLNLSSFVVVVYCLCDAVDESGQRKDHLDFTKMFKLCARFHIPVKTRKDIMHILKETCKTIGKYDEGKQLINSFTFHGDKRSNRKQLEEVHMNANAWIPDIDNDTIPEVEDEEEDEEEEDKEEEYEEEEDEEEEEEKDVQAEEEEDDEADDDEADDDEADDDEADDDEEDDDDYE